MSRSKKKHKVAMHLTGAIRSEIESEYPSSMVELYEKTGMIDVLNERRKYGKIAYLRVNTILSRQKYFLN